MTLYCAVITFIFGLVLGSFYTVVGERMPEGKSIVSPPSHCPNCGHVLKFYELIPVFSFIFLRGKCSKCKSKIPVLSTLMELLTGILFLIAFLVFGISIKFFIALVFISMLIIIIVSDIRYMLIDDEVLIIASVLIFILSIFEYGIKDALLYVLYGVICFIVMFLIKILGDFIFKNSIGRCDLEYANIKDMRNSIEKLKAYDNDIKLYSGHGEDTTLNYEKNNNYYFN